MLAPSAHSKKLPFKATTADRNSILLDIKGYETRNFKTGWNADTGMEKFRAFIDDQNLSLRIYVTVPDGKYWTNTNKDIEETARAGGKFRSYITNTIEKSDHSKANSFDSGQEVAAITYELNHYHFKFCYFAQWAVAFGDSSGDQFNPLIRINICTPKDLNLSIKNPEKFFIVDDRNQKVRLNLSYQNLGQKIAALKTSTPSTANQSGNEKTRLEQKCLYGDTDSCRTLNKNRSPNSSFGKKFVTGAPSPAGPNKNQGALDRRSATVQKRLETLKNLETNGLISSEEARKKRQEILKDL